ncbi:multicopper oxidase domain-containing protein [Arthrobacter sp. OV608]|uniref:multicopper oxidase family protein n=1 Tax=Arthrobacter sp. OV608 TaxID=1882768 RepID=UPI0008BD7D71|nr:multicopper oxidase domain-containing protein [Arthrobacter sp. OV608]SEQ64567.1 Multicopper oxidase with three cupredoxin domains (includes cell division protein FtsP and spore coat protein CotA) [Arthrobacter sp. OV608]
MKSRREALKLGLLGGVVAVTGLQQGAGLVGGVHAEGAEGPAPASPSTLAANNMPVPYRAVFKRPPELVPYETGLDPDGQPFARYSLSQRLGQAQIANGPSTTLAGYNGIFPGPSIQVQQGTRTEVRISNRLPAQGLLYSDPFNTVTHLHGSASLPQYDGYANDRTAPGRIKNYHYPNWQAARTLWYHDHNHMLTAQGVYSGLAALYTITNSLEREQLPQGEFDVPILVSDVMLNADGSLGYNDNGHAGLWGDIIMVNGVPWPTMKVKPRIYRFRFLVGSITRSYRFSLSTGDPFYVVGTDAGMTPTVQAVSSWRQGTAERYEVLIDFRKYKPGQSVELRNLSNKNNVNFANTGKVMKFEVVADAPSPRPESRSITSIPTTLDPGEHPTKAEGGLDTMSLTPDMAVARRTLRVRREGGEWTINGDTWDDVEKSGFRKCFANPQRNQVEEWTIVNESGGWFHPVHIHLIDGKIIGRNTNGGKPFAWENGPKDVFYAGENEAVTVLMQFDTGKHEGGRYMVHCHNLVHEDHDMMVQFAVGDLENNDPITSDAPVVENTPEGAFASTYKPSYPAGT